MADTVGLLKTRGEWTDAVANGETALTHQEWYDQKYGGKMSEADALKAAQAGYNKKTSAARTTRKGAV